MVTKKIKKLETVEDCVKLCQAADNCHYYKWKVRKNCLLKCNHCVFQTNRKVKSRQCFFLRISYKTSNNNFSGPQYNNKYAIHAYTHGPVTGSGPGWPWSGFSAPV